MGFFDNLMAPFGTGAQDNAARDQILAQQRGQQQGQGFLNQGRQDIQGSYAAGLAPLQQTYNSAQQGAQAYGDASGANGQAGNARGLQNFQAGPGYQFALNQGIQNVDRNRAATGALNSGGTDTAVADYTTGLANQQWQQHVQNLLPYLQQQSQAGGQIGALNASMGNQLANNSSQSAGLAYGSNVAQGNAQANADLAPLQAGQNLWSGIGNLANLGVGGGGAGGGTIGGNAINGVKNWAGGLFGSIGGGGGGGPGDPVLGRG